MAKTLLLEENPLVIQPSLAKAIGLNEAIVLQQVHYWLNSSKHTKDGRKWIYNSMNEWNKQFPFWEVKTVSRTFKSLESKGILLTGNFNDKKFDKTIWYSIDYEMLEETIKQSAEPPKKDAIEENNSDSLSGQNVLSIPPKCPNHMDNLGEPIPETTTETNTENNNKSVSQSDTDYVHKTDKDGLTDEKLTEKQLLEQILSKCEIEAACQDKDIARTIVTAIQNLYYNSAFAKENLGVPLEVVRENLRNLDSEIIMYAVYKFQRAAAFGKEIFNPVKYLQTCIYNSIAEYPASLLGDHNLAQMSLDNKDNIKPEGVEALTAETSENSLNRLIEYVKGTAIEQPIRELQSAMPANAFEQYLATARIDFISDSILRIVADSEFTANVLELRYKKSILKKVLPLGITDIEIVSVDSISA